MTAFKVTLAGGTKFVSKTAEENSKCVLSNPNVLVTVRKGIQVVKLCSTKSRGS